MTERGEPELLRAQPGDLVDALRRLAVLRDRDVLTESEFQRAKVKVADDRRFQPPHR